MYKNQQKQFSSIEDFYDTKIYQTSFKIKNAIENEIDFKSIEINKSPFDVCQLPDKKILCADCDGKRLILYDKNFKLIKTIKKINRIAIQPTSIAINQENQVYISDVANHRIIMTDLNFYLIKSVGFRGDSIDGFCCPFSICYKNHNLYICDTFNHRIQIYSYDLKFIESIKLSIQPFSIQVSDSIICINCKYFYNVNTLALDHEHENYFNKVSEINSCFYSYDCILGRIYCFNQKGSLSWVIDKPEFKNLIPNGKFFIFGRFLILTSYTTRTFLKFKL
jgi:hypothetical protein